MTTTKNGNRQRLPKNALRACASCDTPRGNVRKEWTPITSSDGRVIGYTCPACPTYAEPIRREESGRFLAVVGIKGQDGKRRQIKRRFDMLADAREWVTETREGASRSSTYTDPSRLTVRALCERWLAKRAEEVGTPGGIREVTLNGYRSALHAPLLHMGDRIARDVTPSEVETMLRTLATFGGKWGRPLSHRSIVYALTALRQAFNYAVREGWLRGNPATLAKPPRAQHGTVRRTDVLRWIPSELGRFREHADT